MVHDYVGCPVNCLSGKDRPVPFLCIYACQVRGGLLALPLSPQAHFCIYEPKWIDRCTKSRAPKDAIPASANQIFMGKCMLTRRPEAQWSRWWPWFWDPQM